MRVGSCEELGVLGDKDFYDVEGRDSDELGSVGDDHRVQGLKVDGGSAVPGHGAVVMGLPVLCLHVQRGS